MANAIYDRLLEYLDQNRNDQGTVPEPTRIFDDATATLPQYLARTDPGLWQKRLSLMRLLAAGISDPHPRDVNHEVNLLLRLFDGWTWMEVCEFGTHSVPFADGLAVGDHMQPFNFLMLSLLEKATATAADAAIAASMLEMMEALVKLWLGTGDAGIASQAGKLLLDLLKVDHQVIPRDIDERLPRGGQGQVWGRIFADKGVYVVFFRSCGLESHLYGRSKTQKTLAQARLLDWLPKVAEMDWATVSRVHHGADFTEEYGFEDHGLLQFAALEMVDFKDDILLYRCLVDFYAALLTFTSPLVATGGLPALTSPTTTLNASPALQYLIMHGVHARTIAIYLQTTEVDPMEATFLYGPAANYIAAYASRYPEHFLASQLPKQIDARLATTLDLSAARWAHADSPKHDLHLVASLPRKALLPSGNGNGDWKASPLALLPSKSTNPDVLHTLATIFHGPPKDIRFPISKEIANPAATAIVAEEAAASRALYFTYLAHNPRFWADVTSHADTIALKELALSALSCLLSVITANWESSDGNNFLLPTSLATPETGALAILSPPALEYTLPYIMKPPRTFANIVGGRGDTESAAYKIAAAKFDAVKALHGQLLAQVQKQPGEGYEEIVEALGKRLAEGPLSREGEMGGKIATMES